jgi:hypothetical protein
MLTKENLLITTLSGVLDCGSSDVEKFIEILDAATNKKYKLNNVPEYLVNENFPASVYENAVMRTEGTGKMNIEALIGTAYDLLCNEIEERILKNEYFSNYDHSYIADCFSPYVDLDSSKLTFHRINFIDRFSTSENKKSLTLLADEIEAIVSNF